MKVLFLDIDGVLNSENWFGYRLYCVKNNMFNILMNFVDTDDRNIKHKLTMLDDRAIANLNRIVEETGCKVVLSSSWRSSRESDNAFTEYILKLKGFKYELYGVTPRIWVKEFGTQRGEEIQLWINEESKNLQDSMQRTYLFYEFNQFSNVENASKAKQIVNLYNLFVDYYGKFISFPMGESRMSVSAQQFAKKAEETFNSLITMIVGFLSEQSNE